MAKDKINKAIENLKMISMVGDRLSQIECSGRIYSLDDDLFGDIMFMRDLADEALKDLEEMGED